MLCIDTNNINDRMRDHVHSGYKISDIDRRLVIHREHILYARTC